jgi:hypothetical protein
LSYAPIRWYCVGEATPVANTNRLARRLNLTDAQKAALKDLTDGSASADASAKKSPCADKPDLSPACGSSPPDVRNDGG